MNNLEMIRKRLVNFKDKYFPKVDLNDISFMDKDPLTSKKIIELPNMINEIDDLLGSHTENQN